MFFVRLLLLAMLVAALPSAALAAEPNDTEATATGPVRSDVRYDDVLEIDHDEDVYAVHVEAVRTLAVTIEATGDSGPVCVRMMAPTNRYRVWSCADSGEGPVSELFTVPRGTHLLTVSGGNLKIDVAGTTYAFTVSAPGGLTTAECLAAQDDGARFAREIERSRGRLARAGDRLARQRNRATIRDLRLALERARQRQGLDCASSPFGGV